MDVPSHSAVIRIGTSGWSYPKGQGSWNGVFYPPSRSSRGRRFDELSYYAEHFDTVEINSTFYRLPAPDVAAGWARRTPPNFEFAVKLFQKFTHPAMFAGAHIGAEPSIGQEDVDAVRSVLDPLAAAGKLGPLLAQFPPGFHADTEAKDYLHWLLSAFRDYQVAIELRHRTWSDAFDDTAALLAPFNAAWVQIDEPQFRSSIAPNLRPNQQEFSYMRLHGRNADAWWQHEAAEDRYNYLYSPEELEPFAEAASAARRLVKKLYLYLNNHFESKSVANAVMLKSRLGLDIAGRYSEAFIARFPAVRDLVEPESDDSPRLI